MAEAIRDQILTYGPLDNWGSSIKSEYSVMPVLDQARDDESGAQNHLKTLDSGFHRNDVRGAFCRSSIDLVGELDAKL
jgi:hypothetical protein